MYKGYVALFVCFVTREIHLELVMEASTKAFIAALQLFIARRGRPSDIYSDCGTNFIGAVRELRDFMKFMTAETKQESAQRYLCHQGKGGISILQQRHIMVVCGRRGSGPSNNICDGL
jgi:hypothetical protein